MTKALDILKENAESGQAFPSMDEWFREMHGKSLHEYLSGREIPLGEAIQILFESVQQYASEMMKGLISDQQPPSESGVL